jgi:hypothetical protein
MNGIMNLFERLRLSLRAARQPDPKGRVLFVGDEEFDERIVLPVEAAEWVRAEIEASRNFGNVHAADGGGWTDIRLRAAPPLDLAVLGLDFEAACAAVGRHLPEFRAVVTGTLDKPQKVFGGKAFGRSWLEALVLTGDPQTGVLSSVDVIRKGGAEEEERAAQMALSALAELANPRRLILVSWPQGTWWPLIPSAAA